MMQTSKLWIQISDLLYKIPRIVLIFIFVSAASIPFIYLFLNSIKPSMEFLETPPTIFPSHVTLENYQQLFSTQSGDVTHNLINSIVITAVTTLFSVFFGALGAYSLARLRMPFNLTYIIGFMFLVVRFYPKITTTLPYYVLMRNFHLLDTQMAIIIAHVSITLPFALWLMLTFFKELPKELEQSAMLDGCSPWQRFTKVVLPLTIPALGTAAILTALISWNEFLIASSLGPINAKTMPVVVTSFVTDKGVLWGPMSAMSSIIVLPIMLFALFAQRYLVRGLTLGAVKE
jgi:multiple sugar transport system permease protein